jgi:RNA polymerase sigma-70 factor (ECF subfamily)
MWARVSETDEAEARTNAQGAELTGADDAELRFVLRLRQRDERAFNELVLTFQDRIFRLVWRMVGRRDEAEDMTQEVFVQVFKAIDQFRGDSQLSTWIYRIAVNLCKNRTKYHQRRYQKGHTEFDGESPRAQEGSRGVTTGETTRPDQLVQGYQMEQIVQMALRDMDPDFREVLVLRDVECLSYDEIGSITGLAEGTVKSRIHRARTALETAVERALGEKLR